MTTALWLDDDALGLRAISPGLALRGVHVEFFTDELELVVRLRRGPPPSVVIQDLHRDAPAVQPSDLPARKAASADGAGWRFYEEVLRILWPDVPVIIVSQEAYLSRNQARAEDFNLRLFSKSSLSAATLAATISELQRDQRLVLAPRPVPAVVTLDFERVNTELVRYLATKPHALHDVSPAAFERLIEVLLKELGYDVVRTKFTRDGGVDLWAVMRSDLGEAMYAIDAKKYRADRIVGPEPVRAIYGVADLAGASAGMIVTTAAFGPEARRIASQYRYRVSLRDFDGVVEWIRRVAG